jgi:hypothetical protein
MNTWETLSAINVNDHKQMKGKFNYLSWTWAWATLMDNYPDSTYEFLPNEIHGDGSVTTHCTVTVRRKVSYYVVGGYGLQQQSYYEP